MKADLKKKIQEAMLFNCNPSDQLLFMIFIQLLTWHKWMCEE